MSEETDKQYIDEVGERGVKWLRSKHSDWILAVISFVESVFAPIIIDPFLVALILAKRERWLFYTIVAVVFSVLGGLAGYLIGAMAYDFVGHYVIDFYNLQEQFVSMASELDKNAFAFVLLGALTPIPYKLVAIASGLAKIDIITFLFASIVGRILRLGLVGYAAYQFGPQALPIIRRHLLTLAYIIGFALLVYLIINIVK